MEYTEMLKDNFNVQVTSYLIDFQPKIITYFIKEFSYLATPFVDGNLHTFANFALYPQIAFPKCTF